MWRSEIDHEGFPTGITILGSDDATGECFMLYFDERKISRKYEVSFQDGVITWWREAPGFSQRYTWNNRQRKYDNWQRTVIERRNDLEERFGSDLYACKLNFQGGCGVDDGLNHTTLIAKYENKNGAIPVK